MAGKYRNTQTGDNSKGILSSPSYQSVTMVKLEWKPGYNIDRLLLSLLNQLVNQIIMILYIL